MQSKFRFSLDGVDATARQFSEVRRQLMELSAGVGERVSRLGGRIAGVERGLASLTADGDGGDVGSSDGVVVPASGGTGVRNVSDRMLSEGPRKTVYALCDGTFGTDCSAAGSMVDAGDADEFILVDALRRVKWRVYWFKDDLNLKLDDSQPVVGLLAEDLDEAGLGFFCEYDDDGIPVGVDYPKLGMAALRLAQEAMDEVDGLRSEVARLSSLVGKMSVSKSE